MRRLAKSLGVALGVTLVTCGLLEFASRVLFEEIADRSFDRAVLEQERSARIVELRALLDNRVVTDTVFIPHPYLGYVGRPGAIDPYVSVKGRVSKFNGFGVLSVLDRPYPSRLSESEFVVGVLGGSVAEIFANTQENILQHYLEKFSADFDRRVVMVNLALGGFKQPQQLFQLQYAFLLGFQFDAVLNIDGFNEVAFAVDNHQSLVHPIFPSAEHTGILNQVGSRGALAPQTVARLHEYYGLHRDELWLLELVDETPLRHSAFMNLLSLLGSRRFAAEAARAKVASSREAHDAIPPELRGPRRPWPRDPFRMAARIWQDASLLMDAACRSRGVPYVHILQPNQYVEGAKVLTEEELRIAYNADHPWATHARDGYRFLRVAGGKLRQAKVLFDDASMMFREVDTTIYVDDCCHLNRLGNQQLAARVARILAMALKDDRGEGAAPAGS